MQKKTTNKAALLLAVPIFFFSPLALAEDFKVVPVPDNSWPKENFVIVNPSKEPIRNWNPQNSPLKDAWTAPTFKQVPIPDDGWKKRAAPPDAAINSTSSRVEHVGMWRRENTEPKPIALKEATDSDIPASVAEPKPTSLEADDLAF